MKIIFHSHKTDFCMKGCVSDLALRGTRQLENGLFSTVSATLTMFLCSLQTAVQDSLLKSLPADEQTESMKEAGRRLIKLSFVLSLLLP